MAVESFEAGVDRKHLIGPDLVEELRELIEADDREDTDQWRPAFDPESFAKENQPLSLERFKLSEDELKAWAERCSRIRAEIDSKAKRLVPEEPAVDRGNAVPRSRKGQKRSKASHNPEGLRESELKELRLIESAPCKYYKKRHLKNLTDEEVEEIIAAAKKPGWFRTDIAQKYRVPVSLVNKLCKEAEKQPEKMEARRRREQLQEEKKDVIEEITTDILKASKPIVRA